MGLIDSLRPKWKSGDADVRLEAAKELEDPEILCKMIVKDTGWFVRHNAFARLRELKAGQKWYVKLMQECKDEEVRRKVVKVMTDESELERIAKSDKYRYVRDAAEHRLNELRENTWGEKPEPAEASKS